MLFVEIIVLACYTIQFATCEQETVGLEFGRKNFCSLSGKNFPLFFFQLRHYHGLRWVKKTHNIMADCHHHLNNVSILNGLPNSKIGVVKGGAD